jgi:hypothetical protein
MSSNAKNNKFSIVDDFLRGELYASQASFDDESYSVEMEAKTEDNGDNSLNFRNDLNTEGETEEIVDTSFNKIRPGSNSKRANLVLISPDEKIQEELIDGIFTYVKCKNVTTLKIDGRRFSFLSNPINDNNFFFMKMNKESFKFELMNPFVYSDEFKETVKIPYNSLKEFKLSLDDEIDQVRGELSSKETNRKMCSIITIVGLSILFAVLIALFYSYAHFANLTTKIVLTIIFLISSIMIVGNQVYKYKYNLSNIFTTYDSLLNYQNNVEGLIATWNKKCFSNYDISAHVPLGFQYVQFKLNPDVKFRIVDHDVYY